MGVYPLWPRGPLAHHSGSSVHHEAQLVECSSIAHKRKGPHRVSILGAVQGKYSQQVLTVAEG
eukprot:15119255-Alexandrium_andersonii.AAC.1